MIRATGVIKTYQSGFLWWRRETPVLRGFDFQAFPGQVTGVLGPNGAGKTTFFRIICGLETMDGGAIEVNGINPATSPEQMRGQIALLPEDPGVDKAISGQQHLWTFGAMMGMDKAQILSSMSSADDILHLSYFWRRNFNTYSRGQRARISLARMKMMSNSSVFIFDEPSNGLDFEAVTRLHAFIRHLACEGKTVLVASHIISDLRHLCDSLVGINDGLAATPELIDRWLSSHALSQGVLTNGAVMSPQNA